MASFIRTTLRCLGPEHLCTQLMLCLSVPLRRGSLILTGSTIFYSLVNKPSCCWLRYCYVSELLTLTCALLIVCLYRPPEPVSLPKQSSICADGRWTNSHKPILSVSTWLMYTRVVAAESSSYYWPFPNACVVINLRLRKGVQWCIVIKRFTWHVVLRSHVVFYSAFPLGTLHRQNVLSFLLEFSS